jgi:YfiH family protein
MALTSHSSFFGPNIVAVTSDRAVDFHKGDPARTERFVLTESQREWLSGQDIPTPDTIVFPKQVHGDVIIRATLKDAALTGRYAADAVVTDQIGLPIAVRTADCAPILLLDPSKKVIAAVHAGWKSTKLLIVVKTVEVLKTEYGVTPSDLRAVIGPCIRRDSYQVGPEFREHFPDDVSETARGLCLDLAGANVRQLLGAGVRRDNVFNCGRDTFSDPTLHSFRRDGETAGRMINLIVMQE